MMKRTEKSSPPITPEISPMMVQACHAGMKVLRYFSDPMSMKMEADPIKEITKDNKTLTIMPMIRSLWRRFLIAISVSRTSSLRMAFVTSRNASAIFLTSDN